MLVAFPDDTPIAQVEFSTRIQNVLAEAGPRTVGEVREASDEMLVSCRIWVSAQLPGPGVDRRG
jgi:hypothetical protein